MSISLYRKYRPITFDDVVGQSHVTRTLANAIRQDRVSHAYLFAGPRGTGKTSTAKILAMALNCESGDGRATIEPDGTCTHCAAIRRGSSLDVLEIDAASNRGIDEIRDIRDRVNFAPVEGRMKVYIVDEVHMLTPEAFNALLKMLEEPPAHVVFVLATTEPHKVLPTILSRCQRFDFRRPSAQEIGAVLAMVADREGIDVTESALSVIARAAGGSFRDAVSTLDQLSAYCEGKISLQDALTLLGVAEQDLLFELVDVVDERDTKAALLFVERLAQSGSDLNQFLKDMLGHLRDLYVVRHTVEPPDSIVSSEEHLGHLRSQANRVPTAEMVAFIDLVGDAQRAIRQGADPRLELELALIKLTRPDADATLRGVLARLEKLEAGGGTDHGPAPNRSVATSGTRSAPDEPAPEKKPTAAPADQGDRGSPEERPSQGPTIKPTVEHLTRAWPAILDGVKRQRPSLYAVLSEAKPESIENDVLTLKFPAGADFPAKQATKSDNALFLSDVLAESTGRRFKVASRLVGATGAAQEPEETHAKLLTKEELVDILKTEFDAHPVDDDTTR